MLISSNYVTLNWFIHNVNIIISLIPKSPTLKEGLAGKTNDQVTVT